MVPDVESTLGGWDDTALVPLAELNEQLLELLCAAAEASAEPRPRLPTMLSAELRALTPPMRTRLAQCPYLLLDAGFSEPEHWQPAPLRVMDATPGRSYFAGVAGATLLRRSLLLAWHLARTNRVMARLTLGMSSQSAERIAQLRLRDLEWLAELSPSWIRPRWEGQPHLWRRLIVAAQRENPTLLRQLQLHGVTLLAVPPGQRQVPLC